MYHIFIKYKCIFLWTKKKVLLAYENPIRMELFLKIFFSYWKYSFWSSWITWAGQISLCFFTFAFLGYLTFKERGDKKAYLHVLPDFPKGFSTFFTHPRKRKVFYFELHLFTSARCHRTSRTKMMLQNQEPDYSKFSVS